MTQQPYEIEVSTNPPAKINPFRAVIVLVFAFLVFGIGNAVYEVTHPYKSVSAQQLSKAQPAPPNPAAFDEKRDGSNALGLEDQNGKATIWDDSKTGSRIFCFDSCTVLPSSHRHHRRK